VGAGRGGPVHGGVPLERDAARAVEPRPAAREVRGVRGEGNKRQLRAPSVSRGVKTSSSLNGVRACEPWLSFLGLRAVVRAW
jgi:hypothetical protein